MIYELGLHMIAYEFYTLDKANRFDLIGILPERRKDQKRITTESVINLGKKGFCNGSDSPEVIFYTIELEERE